MCGRTSRTVRCAGGRQPTASRASTRRAATAASRDPTTSRLLASTGRPSSAVERSLASNAPCKGQLSQVLPRARATTESRTTPGDSYGGDPSTSAREDAACGSPSHLRAIAPSSSRRPRRRHNRARANATRRPTSGSDGRPRCAEVWRDSTVRPHSFASDSASQTRTRRKRRLSLCMDRSPGT
jgi:hypothetical protein